jgi:hypothetical protein
MRGLRVGRALMEERERRMVAVRVRLERVSAAQDLGPVLEDAALSEADGLGRTLTDDPGSVSARHLLGWLHWHRYQALPEGQDQDDLRAAVSMFSSCFLAGVGDLPEPLLSFLADQAVPAATERLKVAQRSKDQELLPAVTYLWQRIFVANPCRPPRPRRASDEPGEGAAGPIRAHQGGGLPGGSGPGERVGGADPGRPRQAPVTPRECAASAVRPHQALADLDAAIAYFQEAVQAAPAGNPGSAPYLLDLGVALQYRFEVTGVPSNLDAVITPSRRPCRPPRPVTLAAPGFFRASGSRASPVRAHRGTG